MCFLATTRVVMGIKAGIPSVSLLQLVCHGIRGRNTKYFIAMTRVVMGFKAGIPSVS